LIICGRVRIRREGCWHKVLGATTVSVSVPIKAISRGSRDQLVSGTTTSNPSVSRIGHRVGTNVLHSSNVTIISSSMVSRHLAQGTQMPTPQKEVLLTLLPGVSVVGRKDICPMIA